MRLIGEPTISRDEITDTIREIKADIRAGDAYEDDHKELEYLREARDELNQYDSLLRDDQLQDYAEEYAIDAGTISRSARSEWPLNHIDWEAAADELSGDLTSLDFDTYTYYVVH